MTSPLILSWEWCSKAGKMCFSNYRVIFKHNTVASAAFNNLCAWLHLRIGRALCIYYLDFFFSFFWLQQICIDKTGWKHVAQNQIWEVWRLNISPPKLKLLVNNLWIIFARWRGDTSVALQIGHQNPEPQQAGSPSALAHGAESQRV